MNRTLGRRYFLRALGWGAASLAVSGGAGIGPAATSAKPLRGLFPIAFTPVGRGGQVNLEALAEQVTFCNRGGVHGLMWPQIASGWLSLSDKERLDGAEAILSAGKGGKTAIVIGVQGPDIETVTRYAKHAEKLGADAIISLPPNGMTDENELLAYYQEVGRLTGLPMFAQSIGDMSVDLMVRMYETVPTLRYLKDEAGDPLTHAPELIRRTNGEMKLFSGRGVGTMITEMERGFLGHCPYTTVSDVFAQAFDLWHAGKHREAFDMFGRIQAFGTITPLSSPDILIARGVFPEGAAVRSNRPAGADEGGNRGGRGRGAPPLSTAEIRRALETYLGPYLKG